MISRVYDWLDKRTGIKEAMRLKKGQAVPSHFYFYCFGGISLFIIILQMLTGVFMMFYYTPHPDLALKSIEQMSNDVFLGGLTRNMHRWGATLLMATIFTHMVSVVYQKAYRNPRELNWISGVLQFGMVFLFLITGIILPWDWRAYWSYALWVDYIDTWPIVGAMLKNFMLDTFTINRTFITHVVVLPLILFVLLIFHFKMVKRHGISEPL